MIEFRGIFFDGFKFKRTNLYQGEFFEKLINEGSHYSKEKYKDALEEQINEEIHIKLSYSIIYRVLSISGLIFGIILGMKILMTPAFIVLGIGFISQILFDFYKKRANQIFFGKEMSKQMVNLVFNKFKGIEKT